LTFYIK